MNDNETIVKNIESKIGYTFNNKELLLEALTHSSFTNEMKINKRSDYERLEFLGDSVLELLSSEFLYDKYPTIPEGGLSKKRASMVCEPSLAICAREMEIGKYMFLGKGEEGSGGRERDSILADMTEAILGAIYLDGGLEASRNYVNDHILNFLTEDELFVDNKTTLQEYIQHIPNSKNLVYEIIGEEGPEHEKIFTVQVRIGEQILGEGKGKTKKSAEQMAALAAIKNLK